MFRSRSRRIMRHAIMSMVKLAGNVDENHQLSAIVPEFDPSGAGHGLDRSRIAG